LDFDQTFTSAATDNGASEIGDFMIKEHHRVVLKKEVPDHGLKTGDVGTVIHVHKKGVAFEVEFLTLQGGDRSYRNFRSFAGSSGSKTGNHSRSFVAAIVKYLGVGQNKWSSERRKTIWKP